MANLYKSNNRLLGGKIETVSGVAEVLTSDDFDVRVNNVDIGLDVTYTDVKGLDGTMTNELQIPGIVRGTMSFDFNLSQVEFTASGTSGSPTWTAKTPFNKYFESAGLVTTVQNPSDESTNDGFVSFVPSSASCSTITEALYDVSSGCGTSNAEGIEYKLKGIVNSFTIESSEVGSPLVANFDGAGGVAGVADIPYVNIPVFDDANVLSTRTSVMLNTDILITPVNLDGSDITPTPTTLNVCSDVFTLDSGIEKGEITCQQDSYGIMANVITAKKPMLSITPLLTSIAEMDWWEAMTTETVYKIEIINYVDATKTDKSITIEIPRAQLISGTGTDSNGYRRIEEQFAILKNIQGVSLAEKESDYKITIYGKTIDTTTP